MKCPKCGKTLFEVKKGLYECEGCGANFRKKQEPPIENSPVGTPSVPKVIRSAPAPINTPEPNDSDSKERKMYKNIGGKIKTLTAVVTVIGIIASIIVGIVALSNAADIYKELGEKMPFSDGFVIFLIYFIAIPFGIWVSSFFAYGFGELIERTKKTNENSEKMIKMLNEICNNQQSYSGKE